MSDGNRHGTDAILAQTQHLQILEKHEPTVDGSTAASVTHDKVTNRIGHFFDSIEAQVERGQTGDAVDHLGNLRETICRPYT